MTVNSVPLEIYMPFVVVVVCFSLFITVMSALLYVLYRGEVKQVQQSVNCPTP